MRDLAMLLVAICLLSWSSTATAQKSDPFSDTSSSDPFGGGAESGDDPFGGDPFGSGSEQRRPARKADPFSDAPSSNPFGGGEASSQDPFGGDPFGFPSKASRPAKPSAKPRTGSLKSRPPAAKVVAEGATESTMRIRAALDDETTQAFVDTPLQDAILQISRTHDIPIVIDRRALEEIGLSQEEPINLMLRKVTLRSFLRLMLREHELTYVIKDDVMQITTMQAAEGNLVLEMYRFPEELVGQSDTLVKALTSGIVPDAWETLGGPCSVTAIDHVLIVSATENIHEEVTTFLHKLKLALNQKTGTTK